MADFERDRGRADTLTELAIAGAAALPYSSPSLLDERIGNVLILQNMSGLACTGDARRDLTCITKGAA